MQKQKAQIKEFENRRKRFSQTFGHNAGFVLANVYGAMETILSLGEEGRDKVQIRKEKNDTIRVDKVVEDYFIQRIDEHFGKQALILSEEIGKVPAQEKAKVVFVSDPFDGSKLYQRGLGHFWYTTLAMYSSEGEALAAAVCNIIQGTVDFANEERAYHGKFITGELKDVEVIKPVATKEIKSAVIETYLMKPRRLYPAVEIWKPLFEQASFILPNGGPAGYCDVAAGRVDLYLAIEEKYVENFAALPIAQQAGAVITDFDGKQIKFEQEIDKRYFIVCSANNEIHQQVLDELAKIEWQKHPHYQALLAENIKKDKE